MEVNTIIIAGDGEYERRLVRYLEEHFSVPVRIYHFTSIETFSSFQEEAEYYLIEEDFYRTYAALGNEMEQGRKMIVLSFSEQEGCFCKYHNPRELLRRMDGMTPEERRIVPARKRITVIYSPVYEEQLQEIAMHFMRQGDLYLGMEDLGSAEQKEGNMGDLCYYIHLREGNILKILDEMVWRQEGMALLDSPDLYYYLKELTREDYMWFFDKLKKEGGYTEIFLGAGNAFLSGPEILFAFDKIILVDSLKNPRQGSFCNRLERLMKEEAYRGEIEKVYREEVLGGDS